MPQNRPELEWTIFTMEDRRGGDDLDLDEGETRIIGSGATTLLAALGATWSYLYLASGNLLVPVAIHALWNARVFAGTVLGL